jgi:AcrR family transcriptional regulator
MIAQAANELGLERLTLRDVADHLGVSIAGLYHHVSSKEELLRLAAEYSAAKVPLPQDRGQHWAVWLYEWAAYNRDVFLAEPGLLAQYMDGAISAELIAGNVEVILDVLVREGFSTTEANDAYELVTSCALGAAVVALREREAAEAGRPILDGLRDVLAGRRRDELPHLRRLLDEIGDVGRTPFATRIATVLCGIAVRQGQDWTAIETLIAQAAGSRSA